MPRSGNLNQRSGHSAPTEATANDQNKDLFTMSMVTYRYDKWSDWICTEKEYVKHYSKQGWWGRPRAQRRMTYALRAYFRQLEIADPPVVSQKPNEKLNPSSHWRNGKTCHQYIAEDKYKAKVSG